MTRRHARRHPQASRDGDARRRDPRSEGEPHPARRAGPDPRPRSDPSPARPRGAAALSAALLLVAVGGALAAALADLARTAAILSRHRAGTAAALARADGCLADVVATLPAGWAFDAVLAGPDGVVATADDGEVPAPPGCSAAAGAAPGGALPPRILLSVDGRTRDARRVVRAVVDRSPVPGAGSLLWLDGAALLGTVGGSLALDGTDGVEPTRPPLQSVAAPVDPTSLDAWLVAEAVAVAAPEAGPIYAPAPPLDDLVGRALGAGAQPPAATLVPAGTPVPALTFSPGDLLVGTPLRGAGLLVVEGRLDIEAPFQFTGVVVATRGMRVASGGALAVDGSVWLGPAGGGVAALQIDGPARIAADAAALDVADALLALPARARIAGLEDAG